MHARHALNKLKWHDGTLDQAVLWYRHRGAPGGEKACPGAVVVAIRRSFFDLPGDEGLTSIPMHRLLRIEVAGRVIWQRPTPVARSPVSVGPG